ncbi:MAG TPA: hypothetical protein DHN33_07490 [Eubacteriaceae bacterium]|nr:hypothetical protein [Eubacteriaceae bacterium]
MPVFKLCMKIFKNNSPTFLIYIGIFIAISVLMMSATGESGENQFTASKTRVAFFSEENTPITDGLKKSLEQYAEFVDIPDDSYQLQDAMYYGRIQHIIRIPKGFSKDLLEGNKAAISTTTVPQSTSSVYIDQALQSYLSTAYLYTSTSDSISPTELNEYVLDDLGNTASVELVGTNQESPFSNKLPFYFNYMAYSLTIIILLSVSTVLLIFQKPAIQQRNACSPLKKRNINLQFYLAIMVFTLLCWGLFVLLSFWFAREDLGSSNILLYALNSFIFAITVAGISFLVGNITTGREAIVAVSNIVTLGLCFISGVFVPQSLLTEGVLNVAQFFPTYWYVLANEKIALLNVSSFASFSEITKPLIIQGGFAVAFFVLALVLTKRKRFSS